MVSIMRRGGIGRWSAKGRPCALIVVCMAQWLGLTPGCSGDKCPSTNETPCDTPGLWICDACGQTWHCAINYEIEQTSVPCDCITDDGQRLNYVEDTGETGLPTDNPACDSRVYEGPD